MRIILALAVAVQWLHPALALAEVTRGIPRGEERPAVIESLFESPFGEVQFTRVGMDGHSGFLRNNKGYLIGFREVRGPDFCERWFLSEKSEPLPPGCEFVFMDEFTGRELGVRSSEMIETSLFQATRGKLRGWNPTAANGAPRTGNGGSDVAL